jgi:hypothetical protein
MNMRGRIPLGVLAAAALAVALGIAGVLWAQSGGSAGDTARLIPAETAVYVTFNTDAASRQWVQMSQLLSRLNLDGTLREARNSGLEFAELDWEQDVAPFLGGEASLAVTGLSGDTPQVVMILSTSNGDRAWQQAVKALDRLAKGQNISPDLRTYRDTEIRTYKTRDLPLGLSVTRHGRYLIFGTSPEQAQTVLDLADGKGDSLAAFDRFRAARAAVSADPLVFGYVNVAAAGKAAQDIAGLALGFPSFGSVEEALRSSGMEQASMAFAVSAERTGLRFEWQTVGIDGSRVPYVMPVAPDDSRFARRVPAETLAFLSGANLYEIYKGIMTTVDRLSQEKETAEAVRAFREEAERLKRELGFDYDKELLAHLTGEYAFALGSPSADLDSIWGVAMATASDPAAVTRALAAIAAYERRQGRQTSTTTIEGVSVTESRPSRRSGEEEYAYAVAGDELLVGFGPDAIRRALARKDVLADNPDYRDALATLPKGRSLTAFVNLARIVVLAEDTSGDAGNDFLDWQALRRLRYLAVAISQSADRTGGVAFLRIAGE